MRVIAKRRDDVYLILASDNVEEAMRESRPVGRVFDRQRGILYQPSNVHSVLARGYWEETDLRGAELDALLRDVREVLGPALDAPWILAPIGG